MKGNIGDKIKLINEVCYGNVYGLIEVEKDTEMTVISRDSTNEGVITDFIITSKNPYFKGTINVHVWDKDYVVIS